MGEPCLWAVLLLGLSVVGVTEGCGIGRNLDRAHLLLAWGVIGGLWLIWIRWQRGGWNPVGGLQLWGPIGWGGGLAGALNVILIGLGALTLVTALLAPPNSWDSMTYHMSRVAHWQQNKSVEFYPTSISRQLWLAPFAEYGIVQLQILLQGDRGANLVQWAAMVGCALVCSLVAARWGADVVGQRVAALASMTIPEGILEATGTLNDYVLALWVCIVSYFALGVYQDSSWSSLLGMTAAVGLGLLTKATALIFCLPFVLWVLLSQFWRGRLHGLAALVPLGIVVGLINGPSWWREYRLYGNWTDPGKLEGYVLRNEAMSPSLFVSNLLRNLALHVPFEMKGRLFQAMEWTHAQLGVDLRDPRTTWGGQRFAFHRNAPDENRGQNPVHLLLIVSAIGFAFFYNNRGRFERSMHAAGVAVGFLLFCWLLKWQPWHSRLQLPCFVLASPLVASLVMAPRRAYWRYGLIASLLLSAAKPILTNTSRPLVGHGSILVQSREQLYFAQRTDAARDYIETVRFLDRLSAQTVGLCLGPDDWEYPLWSLSAIHRKGNARRFEHLSVANRSAQLASNPPWLNFTPDWIVTSRPEFGSEILSNGRVYRERLSNSAFRVYQITRR